MLDMAAILCYDHTPQHVHRDAPPYTMPEGTLIVNCLIMLTHNHEAEDGSHVFFSRQVHWWQATPTSAPWPRCAVGRRCLGLARRSMLGLRCQRAPFCW